MNGVIHSYKVTYNQIECKNKTVFQKDWDSEWPDRTGPLNPSIPNSFDIPSGTTSFCFGLFYREFEWVRLPCPERSTDFWCPVLPSKSSITYFPLSFWVGSLICSQICSPVTPLLTLSVYLIPVPLLRGRECHQCSLLRTADHSSAFIRLTSHKLSQAFRKHETCLGHSASGWL